MVTPISRSAAMVSRFSSLFSSSRSSVISMHRHCGGSAAAASARRTVSSRLPRLNWHGDTLTATPQASQPAAWRQASCSTQSPRGTAMALSSASAMNWDGISSPSDGWCQRTSASADETRSPANDTTGC